MENLTKEKLEELLSFVQDLAVKTGKLLLDHQTQAQVVTVKDRQDIATTADLASEELSWQTIEKTYPDHGITSEEKGSTRKAADFQWIIDPLDGTKEYVRDLPLFNSSMALEYKGQLVVAAVYRPNEQALYSAALGLGAFKNGKKIHVSDKQTLSDSFVYCYLPKYTAEKVTVYDQAWEQLQSLGKKVYRLRALADENTMMCWVAQGGCEAYLNLSNIPKWHDIAPGLLIAREAGATITDLAGHPYHSAHQPNSLVVSNGLIHDELLSNLSL
jgi:myo-inositol-1(or 4)-monophosphatase